LEDTTYLAQSLSQKKRIRLDTPCRHIYAQFLHTFTATKTSPFHNVKTCAKSSHHEDFAHALIFGWFGDAFLSTSVQKLAILADPILTFYKVGIIAS